jgi:uncharacterized protein
MLVRNLTSALLTALQDNPVVLLHGSRQSGKSTLVQALAAQGHPARYLTLDDAAVASAAAQDPGAFLAGLTGPVIIDEVQLAPGLFRAIKLEVDRQRTAGRFLLTGSADVLLVPKLAESLAGRMEILTLWPFSQGELRGVREGFIDALFTAGALPAIGSLAITRQELAEQMVAGGYPEITRRTNAARREAWFGSYITTILQRDVREMTHIEGLTQMPRLLALLAAQAGGLVNVAGLSRDIGMAQPTLNRYLTLLQATHLYQPLAAWTSSTRRRLIRREKVYLNDTGLHAYLRGLDAPRVAAVSPEIGGLLEAFVGQELRKQMGWSRVKPALYFYRTAEGREVDFVLEDRGGRIVGVEVKAATQLHGEDLRGLADLADAVGPRFVRGVVLYLGREAVAFGANVHAVPVDALWRVAADGGMVVP